MLKRKWIIAGAGVWLTASIIVDAQQPAPLPPPNAQRAPLPRDPNGAETLPPSVRLRPDQVRPDQVRPDQVRPDQVRRPLTIDQASWTRIPIIPPRQIKKEDLVTIRVDIASQMQSEGEVENRKVASYDAVIKDWVILNGLKSIKPSPQSNGDPRIQTALTQLYRAEGDVGSTESMKFDIAAKIVDIRPNGNLVLMAQRTVRNNEEVWQASLSGICRPEDIGPGNLVLSKDIYDLEIEKRESGHVRDGYARGWFTRIFDLFQPF
ncbi:MAG: flagellar L-ring protein precursor FlgH [Pirellulaceae bacterium]|jgi:flagellar L-ring protein precursor FlgH